MPRALKCLLVEDVTMAVFHSQGVTCTLVANLPPGLVGAEP